MAYPIAGGYLRSVSISPASSSDNGAPPARITLRPLASPLPLGLYSFGIGMVLLAAQAARWIPIDQGHQVGIIIASFVFPLESIAAIFAFLARDTLAATVLGLFATSWLTLGLVLITGAPGATTFTQGFYLLAFAAAVGGLAVLAVTGKPLIAVILALSAARAILDGLYQFSTVRGVESASGYVAAVIAGCAWYAGTAMALEDIRQGALLPVFRWRAGRQAMVGDVAQQAQHATGEAGVRQQL